MTLPHTYLAALLLTLLSMICWGSWANTFKLAGKWRFELFYFDFAIGVMVAALLYAYTFGTLGFDGFLFTDDLMHTGRRQLFDGFAGGVVFNLANMLLVAAISLAGMSVAFPVGIGMALVIGVVWNYVIKPVGNPQLLFFGCAIIVGAIIVDALAYRALAAMKFEQLAKTGKVKSTRKTISIKGVVLSIACGLLMGSFFPLVTMGRASDLGGTAGETGMGPYAIGVVFALGILVSTPVFNLFFMNLPVQGEPVEIPEYFRGSLKDHLLGWIGGMIWMTGGMANFVASSAPASVQVGPATSYAIGQGATMVSALWGLLVWKEFAGADTRIRMLLIVMFVLFLCGLALVAIAPRFPIG
jgi:glucose uptake protein